LHRTEVDDANKRLFANRPRRRVAMAAAADPRVVRGRISHEHKHRSARDGGAQIPLGMPYSIGLFIAAAAMLGCIP
jgi:hypothetical protein